ALGLGATAADRRDALVLVAEARARELLDAVDVVPVHVGDDLSVDAMPGDPGVVQLVGRLAAAIDEPQGSVAQTQTGARRAVAPREGASGSEKTQSGGGRCDQGLRRAFAPP